MLKFKKSFVDLLDMNELRIVLTNGEWGRLYPAKKRAVDEEIAVANSYSCDKEVVKGFSQ